MGQNVVPILMVHSINGLFPKREYEMEYFNFFLGFLLFPTTRQALTELKIYDKLR